MIEIDNNKQDGGGFFSSGKSFESTIKKTKHSERALIKIYETMEDATTKYNKAYKTHLTNIKKVDDYAHFNGMEKLFRKVILKNNFKQGRVDKSNPLLFSNYRIMKEPQPSAFRREHILRQVDYILQSSFAGREKDLIKYLSVEVGKSKFILNIVTIENIKKSRMIEHTDYIIDNSKTRSFFKEVLSATKKNLRRHSRVIEINRNSSSRSSSSSSSRSSSSSNSKSKNKTKRSLLKIDSDKKTHKKTKKTSEKHSSSRSKKHSVHGSENNSKLSLKESSRQSIKNISNHLPSKINIDEINQISSPKKITKPSFFMRPSEKKGKNAPPPAPTTAITPTTAPAPTIPLPLPISAIPASSGILGALPALAPPPPPPSNTGATQIQPQQQIDCRGFMDTASCTATPGCKWNPYKNQCNRNFIRQQFGAPGIAPTFTTTTAPPPALAPAPAPVPAIPMITLDFSTPPEPPKDI